jgi:hypothetical protein
MRKDIIKTEICVEKNKVSVIRINNKEYISLTDLARYANSEEPKIPVQTWMRNKDVIAFLGLWERLNNENFKGHEFETFENEAGKHSFYMSPKKWIKETNAIGIISKSGNNGGTFAHSDIAFEFASWLSPEFKLYLIQEFERLKRNESYQYKIDWQANRILSKVNYLVHTDAIKMNIVPALTEEQKKYVYAEEADVLNVALFGMTAKQWKARNQDLAEKGNMRDFTDLLHLVILSNLENINAELINEGIPQSERLIKLNESARRQIKVLENNKEIKRLENLRDKVDKKNNSSIKKLPYSETDRHIISK